MSPFAYLLLLALGPDFYNYMSAVSQVLNVALRNIQDYRVRLTATELTSDLIF